MEVVFSARLEDACDALADRVAAARRQRGPLDPVALWVPSVTVGAYAKMALSRALEIAAHIRAQTILAGLTRVGAERDPPLALLSRDLLRGRVLAALHDRAFMDQPVMAPLRRWITGPLADTQARRRSEVAAKLATLFDEYLLARPRWLADRRAAHARQELSHPTERWQIALLEHVLEHTSALPLAEYVRHIAGTGPLPDEIHVLGWSILPLGVLDALEALSRYTTVHVYAPNPSRQLWADPSISRKEAGSILLAESGRASRELILGLYARTGYDAGDLPAPQGDATTLLAHAQRCLDEATDLPWPQALDDSLQIVACPGVRREVEMVAQEIWRLLDHSTQHDPDGAKLTLDRIAIYYVDREERPYATHIDAVLEEAHALPRRLTDTPLSRETPVVGAVRALLDVPLGDRTRPELLGVLTHPLVRGRWPDIDPDEWLQWCASVGVVRGADERDLDGTYVEGRHLYHWDQGLVRLALGTLTDGTPLAQEPGGEPMFPEPIPGTRARAAGRLVLLARSLLEDARWAAAAELTVAEWVRFLGEYVATYLAPRDQASTAALRACLAAITGRAAVDAGDIRVPYRVAHDLAIEAIDALTARRGAELAGGIHVAPLKVGSVVPFDVIFVLGLDAARFPARASQGDLDLRPRRSEGAGFDDVAEASLDATAEDRDRAAFIEVIGAARRRLILSWESRDAVTGEDKAHASSIGHLLRWSEAVHGAPIPITRLPLRRAAQEVTSERVAHAVPAIGAERRADALGASYAEATGRRPREGEVRAAIAAAPEELRAGLEEALCVVPIPASIAPSTTAPRELRVPLSRIRDFLTCPLQGSARFALGLEDDETDDTLELALEPLASSRFSRTIAVRNVLARGLADEDAPGQITEALHELTARRRARGDAPGGLFGDAERGIDARVLQSWAATLGSSLRAGTLRPLGLGAPAAGAGRIHLADPFVLDTRHGPVTITGQTSSVSLDPRASVMAMFPRSKPEVRPGEVVRAFLDHVLLTLIHGPRGSHALYVLSAKPSGKADHVTRDLLPLTVEAARTFLTAVVEAMLDGPLDVLFPIEAALHHAQGASIDDAVDRVRELLLFEPHVSISSRYGPIRDPAARPAPSSALAQRIMERLDILLSVAPFLKKGAS